jgi:hypothetical protein
MVQYGKLLGRIPGLETYLHRAALTKKQIVYFIDFNWRSIGDYMERGESQ